MLHFSFIDDLCAMNDIGWELNKKFKRCKLTFQSKFVL